MKHYYEIVLNIPHAAIEGIEGSGWPDTEAFRQEVKKWTDWYTEEMFECDVFEEHPRVRKVVFPLSRFVVDVERLENDPLEAKGQGIIYQSFGEHQRILPDEAERERLMELYDQHIRQLKSHLSPQNLLIDCHSFPSSLSDIDVCIGFNEDWSKPPQEVIDLVADTFRNASYKVGINMPYSNAISPVCDFTYHALMIELNKRIYMNEENLEMLMPTAGLLHAHILSLYFKLMGKDVL